MQEMVEMSKMQNQQPDAPPQAVYFKTGTQEVLISAGPAHFGKELWNDYKVYDESYYLHILIVDPTHNPVAYNSCFYFLCVSLSCNINFHSFFCVGHSSDCICTALEVVP